MTLILVRHGLSEGNVRGLIQGQLDHPLTDVGRVQASAVAERLRSDGGADRIVASPLARAFETAQAVASVLDLPVTTDDRLKEYDFGDDVSGLTVLRGARALPGLDVGLSEGHAARRPPSPARRACPSFDTRVAEAVAELTRPWRAGRSP